MSEILKKVHPYLTLLLLFFCVYLFLDSRDLKLKDYQPVSTLKTEQHTILRAKFPVIDIHQHLGQYKKARPDDCARRTIAIMDSCNIRIMVDLDGAWEKRLVESIETYQGHYPGRFIHFVHFNSIVPGILGEPDFEELAVARLEESYQLGARGLKVWKDLGTTMKDMGGRIIPAEGPLWDRLNNLIERTFPGKGRKVIPVDDPRLDPVWEKAGELNMPVLMHTGDPVAFFRPSDRFNERYEQLQVSSDWSFYGDHIPDYEDIIVQRENVLAKHPNTIFIGAHMGMCAEDLAYLGGLLDRYGNFFIDLSASIPIMGRTPYSTREFFIKYQDRILYGSDGVPHYENIRSHFRFLETFDEYMDYPMRHEVNQGRYQVYGIGLPDDVLEKIYYKNAEKILSLAPTDPTG